MSASRLVRTACLAMAAASLPCVALAQLPADGAGIKGVYGGSYTCTDGEHGFYLDITELKTKTGGGFDAAGVLGFFPTVAGISGPSGGVAGSFTVAGTIGADGAVATKAGEWLKRPTGYGAANLEGKLLKKPDDSFAITGKPVVPGAEAACTNLIAAQFLP